jgi:hypothetical protein
MQAATTQFTIDVIAISDAKLAQGFTRFDMFFVEALKGVKGDGLLLTYFTADRLREFIALANSGKYYNLEDSFNEWFVMEKKEISPPIPHDCSQLVQETLNDFLEEAVMRSGFVDVTVEGCSVTVNPGNLPTVLASNPVPNFENSRLRPQPNYFGKFERYQLSRYDDRINLIGAKRVMIEGWVTSPLPTYRSQNCVVEGCKCVLVLDLGEKGYINCFAQPPLFVTYTKSMLTFTLKKFEQAYITILGHNDDTLVHIDGQPFLSHPVMFPFAKHCVTGQLKAVYAGPKFKHYGSVESFLGQVAHREKPKTIQELFYSRFSGQDFIYNVSQFLRFYLVDRTIKNQAIAYVLNNVFYDVAENLLSKEKNCPFSVVRRALVTFRFGPVLVTFGKTMETANSPPFELMPVRNYLSEHFRFGTFAHMHSVFFSFFDDHYFVSMNQSFETDLFIFQGNPEDDLGPGDEARGREIDQHLYRYRPPRRNRGLQHNRTHND